MINLRTQTETTVQDGPASRPMLPAATGFDSIAVAPRVSSRPAAPHTASAANESFLRSLTAVDRVQVGYYSLLFVALAAGDGPGRWNAARDLSGYVLGFIVMLRIVRGGILPIDKLAGALIYRFVALGTFLAAFFQLREIVAAVRVDAYDAQIYAFDMKVFGFEPSVVFDRFVTPHTTEWFAFFYFLHFIILCGHVLPMVFLSRDSRLLSRFALGVILLFSVAHLLYMVVPGYGPYRLLAESFQNDLEGGMFWRIVRETVASGGAQKDIFPSMHTGAPTFFALFSYRNRHRAPFKYTWPLMAFLTTQIIIATLFLRWHYLIDIVAGFSWAVGALLISEKVADAELVVRRRKRLPAAWSPIPWPMARR